MRRIHHNLHHHYHSMLNQHHTVGLHNLGIHHQSKIEANIHLYHHNLKLHHQHMYLELNNLVGMFHKSHHHYIHHHHILVDHLLDSYIQHNPNYNLLLTERRLSQTHPMLYHSILNHTL